MTYETMTNVIRSRFQNSIVETQIPQLPTEYDNHKFEKPNKQIWARVTILCGESIQVSFGSSKRFRTPGIFVVQLFLPLGKGTKDLNELADSIKTTFRSVSVSGVTFRTPSIKSFGRSEEWWQVNINCPFYADDVT